VTREDDSETKGTSDSGTVSDSCSESMSEPQAVLEQDDIPELDHSRSFDKYVWEDYIRCIHDGSGRTNLPRRVEEDAVRETAPGGVMEQSIQQSSWWRVAERLGWAEEDFLKEAEKCRVEEDFLRKAALFCVNELLAWEEQPRCVAEEPLWLFGSEIQRGHPCDGRHPQHVVLEKRHRHQRDQSPGQTPKRSVARPEVPASES
jgi:hypothetical protein